MDREQVGANGRYNKVEEERKKEMNVEEEMIVIQKKQE